MSAALAPRLGFKFMMSVRQGPDAGASFQLLPPHVTIGRDLESHLKLADPRVSRHAAVIDFSPQEIIIQDVSNRNSLQVNGAPTLRASIKDGDLIRIGDSELQFVVEALEMPAIPSSPTGLQPPRPFLAPPPSGLTNSIGTVPRPMSFETAQRTLPRLPNASGGDAGKMRFYVIVLVIGGLVVWLLTSNKAEKPVEPALRTTEVVDHDIKNSETRIDEIIKKRTFKNEEERTRFEEAQRHYLEGFRDYQKGQFMRAMRSFETARAIDPDHELARRYFKLAEKQRDEMVAQLTLEGRQYKEKQMYTRCSASFEKVLDAIPDKEDQKYRQADSLKKECDLLAGERFQ